MVAPENWTKEGLTMAVTKILLIDDSQTCLITGRVLLEREGYEVITARSADEGVSLARRERPDLMVVDVDMPQVGGVEACRQLAADPLTAPIPVVLLMPPFLPPLPGTGPGWRAVVPKPLAAPVLLAEVRRQAEAAGGAPRPA
jgi:CheY-like chemotaxis protein